MIIVESTHYIYINCCSCWKPNIYKIGPIGKRRSISPNHCFKSIESKILIEKWLPQKTRFGNKRAAANFLRWHFSQITFSYLLKIRRFWLNHELGVPEPDNPIFVAFGSPGRSRTFAANRREPSYKNMFSKRCLFCWDQRRYLRHQLDIIATNCTPEKKLWKQHTYWNFRGRGPAIAFSWGPSVAKKQVWHWPSIRPYICTHMYAYVYMYICIYVCCGVIIWAKFDLLRSYYLGQVCFLQNTVCQKRYKIGVSALFFENKNCARKFEVLLSGPSWPFLSCSKPGPDNNTYLAQIITPQNGFCVAFFLPIKMCWNTYFIVFF